VFNRQPFNRGKFNANFVTVEAAAGRASMVLTGMASGFLFVQMSESTADIRLGLKSNPTVVIQPPSSSVLLSLDSRGQNLARFFGNPETAVFELGLRADMVRRIFHAITGVFVMGVDGLPGRIIYGNTPPARITLALAAINSRVLMPQTPPILLVMDGRGVARRVFIAASKDSILELNATGIADMYGYGILDLEGLVLSPGGTLIIDTGEMTVLLNGQDVTRFVSKQSEFFKLRPGDNVIVYEDGVANRNASYNILWKDLWL
jgi:hypothetical protein